MRRLILSCLIRIYAVSYAAIFLSQALTVLSNKDHLNCILLLRAENFVVDIITSEGEESDNLEFSIFDERKVNKSMKMPEIKLQFK